MKKLKPFLIGLLIAFTGIVIAAPVSNVLRNILPEQSSTYEIGTSTNLWLNIFGRYASTTALTASTTVAVTFNGTATSTLYGDPNATSTLGRLSVNVLDVSTTTATSTFSNGIQLSAGCFRLSIGSCVTTGNINSGTVNRLSYYSGAATLDSANFLTVDTGASTLTMAGNLLPNGSRDIGASSNRWANIFASNTDTLTLSIGSFASGNLTVAGDVFINGNQINLGTGLATSTISGGFGIGIGTTTPGAAFAVATSTAGLNTTFLVSNLGSGYTAWFEDTANDTTPFVINAAGNVGIGTTTPAQLLSVQGNSLISGTTTSGSLIATSTLFVGGTTGSSLVVLNSGNVGIGTTGPTAKLDVMGAARSGIHATGKLVYFTGTIGAGQTGDGGFEIRHDNATQGIGFGYNTIYQTGTNPNQELNIRAIGTGPITLNAVGGASGNVGIGTTGPLSKFEVLSQGNSTVGLLASSGVSIGSDSTGVGNIFQIGLGRSAASATYSPTSIYSIVTDTTSFDINDLAFATRAASTDTAPTERMRLTSTGNVGIGTTSPWRVFSVTGTVAMQSLTTQSGSGNVLCVLSGGEVVQDDSPATACSGLSTLKIKKDIFNLNPKESLNDILKMQSIEYRYKSEYSKDQSLHLGFTAEDIDKIDKRLVEYDQNGKPSGLRYAEFVSKIINAMQEQQKEIDELKNKVKQYNNINYCKYE